jgi:hypothetical protein
MKLLAPLLFFGAHAGKEELQAQCDAAKTVYPECGCNTMPGNGRQVFWKGGKGGKQLLGVQDNADASLFMVSIPDAQSTFSFRDEDANNFTGDYKVFLQFARHKCGVSFLEGVADGSVQFDFVDQYAAYGGNVQSSHVDQIHTRPGTAFATGTAPAKKYWTVTVQGYSANTLQSSEQIHNAAKSRGDLPYDGKSDAHSKKKDQVMVFVSGLSGVTFSDTQRDECLKGAFVGVAACETEGCANEPNDTDCMGLGHLYW